MTLLKKDPRYTEIIEKWEKYAAWTQETAIYPTHSSLLGAYPMEGVFGEFREFKESHYMGDYDMREAGDVLWYCARMFIDLDLIPMTDAELRFCVVPELDLPNMHEALKKFWRDKNKDKLHIVRDGLIKIIGFLICMMDHEDVDILDVMDKNMNKLNKRKEEGTIQGDGDNR
jgi:hypothetical protein